MKKNSYIGTWCVEFKIQDIFWFYGEKNIYILHLIDNSTSFIKFLMSKKIYLKYHLVENYENYIFQIKWLWIDYSRCHNNYLKV